MVRSEKQEKASSTWRDVERAAGAGTTTGSHIINVGHYVDPKTLFGVQNVIPRLSYRPSQAAHALKCGRKLSSMPASQCVKEGRAQSMATGTVHFTTFWRLDVVSAKADNSISKSAVRKPFDIRAVTTFLGKLLVLGLLIASVSCAQSNKLARDPPTNLPVSFFPYEGRWHGADGAYSIRLSARRYLWLFGDTFVGRTGAARSAGDAMPRNSIAIADCLAADSCRITHAWTDHRSGPPTAFFDTGTTEFYWPLDGFVAHGTLYIFLEKMHMTTDGGAFNFDYSGVVLASVKNFFDPPSVWKIKYQPVLDGNTVIPGVATVGPSARNEAASDASASPGFVYVFAWRKNAGSPGLSLLRLPEKLLNDAAISSHHWQYLNNRAEWVSWSASSSLPHDAKVIVHGNYTELTVRYHPELKRWLMTLPGGFTEGAVLVSQAYSLSGNWSAPKPIYRFQELQAGDADHTPKIICYAAKEHAELEAKGQFVFTYACNSLKQEDVWSNPRLYHPVFVILPLATVEQDAEK